jgi:hypothetical protein
MIRPTPLLGHDSQLRSLRYGSEKSVQEMPIRKLWSELAIPLPVRQSKCGGENTEVTTSLAPLKSSFSCVSNSQTDQMGDVLYALYISAGFFFYDSCRCCSG